MVLTYIVILFFSVIISLFPVFQTDLTQTGVCSPSRAQTVVEEFMLPLVGDRQRVYEQNLETMEVMVNRLWFYTA